MQNSSSGGNRNSRNSQSRPRSGSRDSGRHDSGSRSGSRDGGRNRSNRSRSQNEDSRHAGSRSESSSSRPPRGGSRDQGHEIIPRRSTPKPTGFQKFIKLITFGLVDLTPKKPAAKSPSSREPKSGGSEIREKRERREPLFIEPTTPRLYVGNLSYEVSSDDLSNLFSAHGTVVEAAIVTQPGSSRSKGFAFVEMGSVDEAKAAATALNDKEFQGRQMLVTGAKSEGRSEGRSGDSGRAPRSDVRGEGRSSERRSGEGRSGEARGRNERGRGGDREIIEKPSRQVRQLEIEVVSSPSLQIAHLNAQATDIDITDLFVGIGAIQSREESPAQEGALTKSLRVDLADTAEAQKAVELLDGKSFMGHQLRVTGVKSEA